MSVKKPEIPEPGESGGIAAPPGPYLLSMQKVRPVTTLGAGLAQLACQNLHVLTVEARKSATGRSGLYPESCKGSQAERGPEDVIPTATLGSRCPQRRCRLSWASNQADGLVFSNVTDVTASIVHSSSSSSSSSLSSSWSSSSSSSPEPSDHHQHPSSLSSSIPPFSIPMKSKVDLLVKLKTTLIQKNRAYAVLRALQMHPTRTVPGRFLHHLRVCCTGACQRHSKDKSCVAFAIALVTCSGAVAAFQLQPCRCMLVYVCRSMCMCAYVYVCVCMSKCTCTGMHVYSMHICTYVGASTCTHVCVSMYTCTCSAKKMRMMMLTTAAEMMARTKTIMKQ